MMEPAWVDDESVWAKAKKKAMAQKPDDLYALTTDIYKKMGGKIKKTKAADSVTSNVQFTRDDVKETKAELSFLSCRIFETDNGPSNLDPSGNLFEVILIQEGMGNLKDLHYYSKEAIQSAVSVFEGKKIYANHPGRDEEHNRPERDVRDVLGWFQDVKAKTLKEGQTALVATVRIPEGSSLNWARDLMKGAVEYSKQFAEKDFIGLSINAFGAASEVDLEAFMKQSSIPKSAVGKLRKALEMGVGSIKVITLIDDAVSCDLVTEAGAGGKILALIEGEKQMADHTGVKEADENKPKHDDAEQDKALIAQMIQKYVGDGDGEDGDNDMASECLGYAKEMGYKEEEALQAAGYGMKMMKHAAKKKADKEKPEGEKKMPKESEVKVEGQEEQKIVEPVKTEEVLPPVVEEKPPVTEAPPVVEEAPKADEVAVTVESLKKENLELKGKLLAFEEAARKELVAKYLDKKLSETKLPRAITDKFRESISGAKSEKEVDKTLGYLMEGFNAGGESRQKLPVIDLEKCVTGFTESNTGSGKQIKLDMSKCVDA